MGQSGTMLKRSVALVLILAACGGAATSAPAVPGDRADLPATTSDEFEAHLADLDRPAVVNVWASWCLPCRSEAPLLNQASERYGEEIEFIGVNVTDNQSDAKAFLAEFGLPFDHFFDRDRQVPNFYGGIGIPITFFFAPNGELVKAHNGILDDRTLALNIDELLKLDS
ncbi:MAG: TlpA family protein disulfide reductase [Acidobacteria bacterium]|nr:TlpA family protein disulfide reductase [Acidobacteriota bacterium]